MANDGEKGKNDSDNKYNFKRFLEKTPCARNSLLYGIIGGLVGGCGRFAYTRQVLKSGDLALAAFALISIGNWGVCRYLNHKHKLELDKAIELVTKYSKSKAKEKKDQA